MEPQIHNLNMSHGPGFHQGEIRKQSPLYKDFGGSLGGLVCSAKPRGIVIVPLF
jgi:hypothetical protein